MPLDKTQIEQLRAQRQWRTTARRVRNQDQAVAFLESVGVALMFPSPEVELPSLWESYTDEPFELGWTDEMETMWRWKNELPSKRQLASGPFVRGKAALVAGRLLPAYAALAKAPQNDVELNSTTTDKDQRAILAVLLKRSPLPAITLRRMARLTGKSGARRFDRAIETLQRAFKVSKIGEEQEADSHWPSQVYDLALRAYPDAIKQSGDVSRDQALQEIVTAHFQGVIVARTRPVAHILSMRTRELDKAFAHLAAQGVIEPADGDFEEGTWVLSSGALRRS